METSVPYSAEADTRDCIQTFIDEENDLWTYLREILNDVGYEQGFTVRNIFSVCSSPCIYNYPVCEFEAANGTYKLLIVADQDIDESYPADPDDTLNAIVIQAMQENFEEYGHIWLSQVLNKYIDSHGMYPDSSMMGLYSDWCVYNAPHWGGSAIFVNSGFGTGCTTVQLTETKGRKIYYAWWRS